MFTATYDASMAGYSIAETDAESVGSMRLFIRSAGMTADIQLAENATRLMLHALNLDGGVERALSLLRAETVRQRA